MKKYAISMLLLINIQIQSSEATHTSYHEKNETLISLRDLDKKQTQAIIDYITKMKEVTHSAYNRELAKSWFNFNQNEFDRLSIQTSNYFSAIQFLEGNYNLCNSGEAVKVLLHIFPDFEVVDDKKDSLNNPFHSFSQQDILVPTNIRLPYQSLDMVKEEPSRSVQDQYFANDSIPSGAQFIIKINQGPVINIKDYNDKMSYLLDRKIHIEIEIQGLDPEKKVFPITLLENFFSNNTHSFFSLKNVILNLQDCNSNHVSVLNRIGFLQDAIIKNGKFESSVSPHCVDTRFEECTFQGGTEHHSEGSLILNTSNVQLALHSGKEYAISEKHFTLGLENVVNENAQSVVSGVSSDSVSVIPENLQAPNESSPDSSKETVYDAEDADGRQAPSQHGSPRDLSAFDDIPLDDNKSNNNNRSSGVTQPHADLVEDSNHKGQNQGDNNSSNVQNANNSQNSQKSPNSQNDSANTAVENDLDLVKKSAYRTLFSNWTKWHTLTTCGGIGLWWWMNYKGCDLATNMATRCLSKIGNVSPRSASLLGSVVKGIGSSTSIIGKYSGLSCLNITMYKGVNSAIYTGSRFFSSSFGNAGSTILAKR